MIETTKYSSWVVQVCSKQIQDGERPSSWNIENSNISATDWPILTKFSKVKRRLENRKISISRNCLAKSKMTDEDLKKTNLQSSCASKNCYNFKAAYGDFHEIWRSVDNAFMLCCSYGACLGEQNVITARRTADRLLLMMINSWLSQLSRWN